MPWRDSYSVPLTRIDVVSTVPSESGIYAIVHGDVYVLVGEAWNLKARLLELINMLPDLGELSLIYELCHEQERISRKEILASELLRPNASLELPAKEL